MTLRILLIYIRYWFRTLPTIGVRVRVERAALALNIYKCKYNIYILTDIGSHDINVRTNKMQFHSRHKAKALWNRWKKNVGFWDQDSDHVRIAVFFVVVLIKERFPCNLKKYHNFFLILPRLLAKLWRSTISKRITQVPQSSSHSEVICKTVNSAANQ